MAMGQIGISWERLFVGARTATAFRLGNQRCCQEIEPFPGQLFCFSKIGFAKPAARLVIDVPVPAVPFALATDGKRSQSVPEGKGAMLFLGQPAIPGQ